MCRHTPDGTAAMERPELGDIPPAISCSYLTQPNPRHPPKFSGADMGPPYVCLTRCCRHSTNGEGFLGASAGMLPIPCKPHHPQLHSPRGWDDIERGTGRGRQPQQGQPPGVTSRGSPDPVHARRTPEQAATRPGRQTSDSKPQAPLNLCKAAADESERHTTSALQICAQFHGLLGLSQGWVRRQH